MSDDDLFRTLGHKKSPKTSRRTTFQDELEEAVLARAKKNNAESHTYSDDFEDDDVLTEILNRRKKKLDTFRKGKKQVKVQDFQLSDEEENARPKRVSFLKSRKMSCPVEGRHVQKGETEKQESANSINSALSESSQPTWSSGKSEQDKGHSALTSKSEESPSDSSQLWQAQSDTSVSQRCQSEMSVKKRDLSQFSPQLDQLETTQTPEHFLFENKRSVSSASAVSNSESRQRGSLSPQLSEEGQRVWFHSTQNSELDDTVTSQHQAPPLPHPRERGVTEISTAESVNGDGPPKPRPRQRMLRAGSPTEEKLAAEPSPGPTLSSSTSIPQSPVRRTETSSSSSSSGNRGTSSHSLQVEKGDSSSVGDGMSLQKSTEDALCNNGLDKSEECREGIYSTYFEENEESGDRPDGATSRQSNASGKTVVIRPGSAQISSSRRSGRMSSYKASSKYLGTLKILDQQLPGDDSQPEAADSLRAAIYQEWLQKKQEKLKAELQTKRREEKLKEEKTREEDLTKKEVAKASYEAWKEKKKETIKLKLKEKQETTRKQEREMNEKEEKKETAKKAFEKWKQEQDEILKGKVRKKIQTENELKQTKEMEKEYRKKDATAAFSKWNETKKDVIQEKRKTERKKEKIKQEEQQYEKEERDQMALEMYEKWMRRKEFQQKREKNEKRIQAILQYEPRPPWSPPNKTVPSGR
ncbi:hypothetical protein ACEWY4_007382 [Coilia grayii]|uniref:Microtubule-associated protein 9 n=1 Tax=Coilia grayii TaxID=363190 RepID=A0ABD1KG99_9TELE